MEISRSGIPNISDLSMEFWLSKLPDDVRLALIAPDEQVSLSSSSLLSALETSEAARIPEILQEHLEDAKKMGRARRVRLLAWIACQPDRAIIFRKIEEDEKSGGGNQTAGIMLLEDIRALVTAMSNRIVKQVASEATIDTVLQAAAYIENDIEFRQGGVV